MEIKSAYGATEVERFITELEASPEKDTTMICLVYLEENVWRAAYGFFKERIPARNSIAVRTGRTGTLFVEIHTISQIEQIRMLALADFLNDQYSIHKVNNTAFVTLHRSH